MSCMVIVTFDLHDAASEDYRNVRNGLEQLGLGNFVVRLIDDQPIPLPFNTFAREISSENPEWVRDVFTKQIQNVFQSNNMSGPIFIGVGADWAWRRFEV